jgi:hypothetical protein
MKNQMELRNSAPTVRASIAYLTPDRCEQIIGSNFANQRNVSDSNFSKIEDDMINDRFHLTGESIIIGRSGSLLDGQHRVLACIKTGFGFWTVLVEGVDDELFYVINTGKSRSLSDVLKINGETNTIVLSSCLLRLAEYRRSPLSICSGAPISTSEAFEAFREYPEIQESIRVSVALKDVASRTRIAWLHCVTQRLNKPVSDSFFHGLTTGEMLDMHSPVYWLRSRLQSDRASSAKISPREAQALIIKAWNAYLDGKSVKCLKWTEKEAFPALRGNKLAS